MADSVNRIVPATIPLGEAEQRTRQRQDKKRGAKRQDKHGETPAPADPSEPVADELPEAEKTKGKHVNIRA